jgi:hypothetical protein
MSWPLARLTRAEVVRDADSIEAVSGSAAEPSIGEDCPASGGTAPASGGTAPASGGTAPTSGGTAPTSGRPLRARF